MGGVLPLILLLLTLQGSPARAQEGADGRLASDVTALAGVIGERNVFKPQGLASAAAHIENRLAGLKLFADRQRYTVKSDAGQTEVFNIAVKIDSEPTDAPLLVLGAHYDTAPGTPGADDNGSGVAALLELAARFKKEPCRYELRLVFFNTEEPPFFGTKQMGSVHYAKALKKEGRPVAGMISLETLGFYSDAPSSQLYPPLVGLFRPSKGNYLALVSNRSSKKLLKALKKGYLKVPHAPALEASAFPQWLVNDITLSDQLSFWNEGYKAVMATDTAFLRNPNYHEASDLPNTLDYKRLAGAVDALESAIRGL
jgi:hypothetical protein